MTMMSFPKTDADPGAAQTPIEGSDPREQVRKDDVLRVETDWQPKIAAFLCNWCSYTGADLAGVSRMKWSPYVRIVRVMCSGRIDPTFVVTAFAKGADGVIISGCHPGDCHYSEGNYKALRRVHLLKRVLAGFGIHPDRLKLTWVSASEGDLWAGVTEEMAETVRNLGPLRLET